VLTVTPCTEHVPWEVSLYVAIAPVVNRVTKSLKHHNAVTIFFKEKIPAFAVAGESADDDVEGGTTGDTDDQGDSPDDQLPGFGVGIAVVGLLSGIALVARGRD